MLVRLILRPAVKKSDAEGWGPKGAVILYGVKYRGAFRDSQQKNESSRISIHRQEPIEALEMQSSSVNICLCAAKFSRATRAGVKLRL